MQTVEWGLNMMPGGGHKLREAERAAKQAKAGAGCSSAEGHQAGFSDQPTWTACQSVL